MRIFQPEIYAQLLDDLWTIASTLSLIVQENRPRDSRTADCLGQFAPFLLSQKRVQEWPGTRLCGGYAELHVYSANSKTRQLAQRYPETLFGWPEQNLPEDLAIYRADGTVALLTVSHEHWAQATVSDTEAAGMKLGWLRYVGPPPVAAETAE